MYGIFGITVKEGLIGVIKGVDSQEYFLHDYLPCEI